MKFKVQFPSTSTLLAGQKGVALIAVLWIFIFLFVVAFEFSMSAREEATAAQRFSDETLGYYLAVAGFERSLAIDPKNDHARAMLDVLR